MTTDDDAFDRGTNDTIVISHVVATKIWNGEVKANTDPATGNLSGDFSVALAVAHEYAHNLQIELGIIPAPPAMQRHAAFIAGYNSGIPASGDSWLLDSY